MRCATLALVCMSWSLPAQEGSASAFGSPCWGSLDRPTLRTVQVPTLGGHLGLEFRGVNTSQQAWLVFGAG